MPVASQLCFSLKSYVHSAILLHEPHNYHLKGIVCTQGNNEEMTCEEMAFLSHGFLKQYRKSSKDSATIFSIFSLFGKTIF